ncbi:MAG: class I SAM-dependent methyltransferase [Chitinophagaceae bacterium]
MNKPTVQCPVCNTQAYWWCRQTDCEYFTTDENFNYYKCSNCHLLFIDEPPVSQLAVIYPSHYYSFATPGKNLVFKIKEHLDKRLFKKILKNIPGNNLTVLDIGGGSGWLLNTVRELDTRITSTAVVDLDSQAAVTAMANGHQYYQSRIETFNTDIKFDLVIMLNLIEHVASPQQVLEKIRSFLSDTGCIVIKTPNCESWDARLFRKGYWGGLHCPRHWNIFDKKSFETIVTRANLQIANLSYTQGAPFWTYSVLTGLMGKTLKAKGKPLIEHPLFPVFSAFFAIFDFIRRIFVPTSQMFVILRNKPR